MTKKKKGTVKVIKHRVVGKVKIAEDRHLITVEHEVKGPAEALPEFTGPVEITPEAVAENKMPETTWYASIRNFFKSF